MTAVQEERLSGREQGIVNGYLKKKKKALEEKKRSRQDSNLRGQSPTDF